MPAAEEPQVRFADVGCGFGGLLGECKVQSHLKQSTKNVECCVGGPPSMLDQVSVHQ